MVRWGSPVQVRSGACQATICGLYSTFIVRCGVILEMAKSKTVELVSLECSSCLEAPRRVHMRNYTTPKNRRNVTEKLELRKYCPRCRKHTAHRESKVK